MTNRHLSNYRSVFTALVLFATLNSLCMAKVELVTMEVPKKQVWVGEKAAFFVKLKAPGSFVGAASFSLPQIPRTVIVNVGNPVVSSEEIEGDMWFTQTHEFALFSQAAGTLELPSFEVRFGNREGFTGPPIDHVEEVPSATFQIKQPGSGEKLGFLVTTEKLDVQETWDPQPGEAKQGDLYHRTITQEAEQVTGMALAPPPTRVPKGVRVYIAKPTVADSTERGAFNGKRSDTLTYVFEQPGRWTLPAIKYVWWNPQSEKFGSQTLPATTFQVAPLPVSETPNEESDSVRVGLWLVAVAIGITLFWQRNRILPALARFWHWWNPPQHVAARKLLRACRRDDAVEAGAAWRAWQSMQDAGSDISPRLRNASTQLQRQLYGPATEVAWRGDELASAFREEMAALGASHYAPKPTLAPLNPR